MTPNTELIIHGFTKYLKLLSRDSRMHCLTLKLETSVNGGLVNLRQMHEK